MSRFISSVCTNQTSILQHPSASSYKRCYGTPCMCLSGNLSLGPSHASSRGTSCRLIASHTMEKGTDWRACMSRSRLTGTDTRVPSSDVSTHRACQKLCSNQTTCTPHETAEPWIFTDSSLNVTACIPVHKTVHVDKTVSGYVCRCLYIGLVRRSAPRYNSQMIS